MAGKKDAEIRDKKDFQAAEELIKDKERVFDAVMSAIGDLVSIHDVNMRIVYQNEILKKAIGDRVGEFCYTVYERRNKICEGCPMQAAYKDSAVHRAVRVGKLPDGTSRRFENVAAVLKNKQGEIIASIEVIREVEEREKIKEELQKKLGELEEFSKIAIQRELKMKRMEEEMAKLRDQLAK
jgi:PAS domain-containing protein